MVWLIVVAAMVVLGLAAVAGTGRFGEMPEPVNDRPKAEIPKVPFGPEYLGLLRLPIVGTGYDQRQVDEFLAAAVNQHPLEPPLFDVVSGGYDMQATDAAVTDAMRAMDPKVREALTAEPIVEEREEPVFTEEPGPSRAVETISDLGDYSPDGREDVDFREDEDLEVPSRPRRGARNVADEE